ncbi:bifunctional folylpolyglutamate synthase/dihydrofolate synthase [Anaerotardibacter muris]|uniref:bifunctional folylpolyglutamate synthase/dihydrofolate synthase n=1 Tax=Anaerotardibacter muris TaxID=2941505 RepID=UPI00203EA513|nr:folylpolyglutamate synthase/dihydrofolate synthase family protein [Anaerotardibacter muris]
MIDPIAYINAPRWQNVSLGLDRTRELLERLGNPQDSLRFVHVAGTNGKGSTCAFIASVMQQAGYRVGLFTSPALYRFEDRIRVNGENIPYGSLGKVTEQVRIAAEAMEEHPTEFELLTAVAFLYFAQQQCDIVVAEVGLGGRLDSTNVIETVEVSVITPIALDHCALLGSTLAQIAHEKAGIIKRGVPVVSAPQGKSVLAVLEQSAHAKATTLEVVEPMQLAFASGLLTYGDRTDLKLGLAGAYQSINAATALVAIDVLRARGWNISEESIRQGLLRARWAGRFERVCEDPLIIFDGGHNVAGMEALAGALDQAYPNNERIVVTGVLEDKDYRGMAPILVRVASEIITITPLNPRALSAADLARVLQDVATAEQRPLPISAAPDVALGVHQALDRARQLAGNKANPPLICVCGSLYMLGSVMEVLRQAGLPL